MAYNDYAVNEEVGIVRYARFGFAPIFSAIGTVTKINGYGHIFVKDTNGAEYRFDKYGNEYKVEYGGKSLTDPNALRALLQRNEKAGAVTRAANELLEQIKDGFSGDRRFHATEERLNALQDALNKIKEMAK